MTIQEARERFSKDLTCDEAKRILEALGFIVRDGKLGGHKVYVHPGIPGFYGQGFNCGHGRNPHVKRAYLRRIAKVIEQYEVQLREFEK